MKLDGLNILGYAESLGDRLVPHIVPPVYQLRDDPDKLLFPPFRLAGAEVLGGSIGTQAQMDQFVREGKCTRTDKPILARPDHELWIDQNMQPRYEPFDVAENTLRQIAEDEAERGRQLCVQGEFEQAEKAANTALAADDRLVDPLVIKAAIARRQGNKAKAEGLGRTAMVVSTRGTFDQLLKALLSDMDSGPGNAMPGKTDRDPAATPRFRAWLCGLATSEPTASPQLKPAIAA